MDQGSFPSCEDVAALGDFSQLDHRYMARALRLAELGRFTARPNPMVGCVIVNSDGEVVGEGWHRAPGEPHAEVHALRAAGERARGATVYVTLEPCCHHGRTGPCADALIAAGVSRVVCATQDPFPAVSGQGFARLQQAGIVVSVGLLAAQAEVLNIGFMTRHRTQRPYVRVKLAMSMDGRTAAADGTSQWITSPQARQDVQLLRAEAGAIVTGIGTVLCDDPSLTVRGEHSRLAGLVDAPYFKQPRRVVVDSRLRFPATAKMLSLPGETWLYTCDDVNAAHLAQRCHVVECPSAAGRVDLSYMLGHLAANGVNLVLVEAGAQLSGALLQAGLVDEFVLYIAPTFLGDAGKGLLALPGLNTMTQQIALTMGDVRCVGADLRIVLKPRLSG